MKENYTQLYPNEQVAKAVAEYAFKHSTELPKHITDHHAWGSDNHDKAHFMISPLQCQFQVWIAKAVGAKRILEIGTFIGFSTMGWAEAVGNDGHVTALEFSSEYADIAKDAFSKYGIKNVDVIVGDAQESLKALPENITEPYDLVFVDADKVSYPKYLELLLSQSVPGSSKRLLKKGSIILGDNVLRRGLMADSSSANPWPQRYSDEEMKALHEFNENMAHNPRLETFLMPLFDGLGMGRVID